MQSISYGFAAIGLGDQPPKPASRVTFRDIPFRALTGLRTAVSLGTPHCTGIRRVCRLNAHVKRFRSTPIAYYHDVGLCSLRTKEQSRKMNPADVQEHTHGGLVEFAC